MHSSSACSARQHETFAFMTLQKSIFPGLAAAFLTFAAAGQGLAQQGLAQQGLAQQNDNWLTHLFQQPPPNAVPGSPPGAANAGAGWSGQSGAPGNPLMTADAIRAAAADFGNCIERLWPEAARRGVSRTTFEHSTTGLTAG